MGDIERYQRLIEEDEARAPGQDTGEKNALSLAAAHLVEVAAGEIGRVAKLESALRLVVVGVAFPGEAPKERRAPRDDHVDRSHGERRIGILRQTSHMPRVFAGRPFSQAAPIKEDLSTQRGEDASDQLQERRFPRAVRAGEGHELRRFERSAHLAQRAGAVVGERHTANLERHRPLRSSERKNGTPRIAVNAPTGSSAEGRMTLDTVSARTRSVAPPRAESGRRKRKSRCQMRRMRWGTSRPTKPMIPLTATAAPVTMDAAANPIRLTRSTSTPRDFASSSPNVSMRRSLAIVISTTVVITKSEASRMTSLHVAPKSVPIIQRSAAVRSLSRDSAKAIRMTAEKSALRTRPERRSLVGSVYSRRRARRKTAAVAPHAPTKATSGTSPGMAASPSAVDTAAPAAAPPDTPRMNGSA